MTTTLTLHERISQLEAVQSALEYQYLEGGKNGHQLYSLIQFMGDMISTLKELVIAVEGLRAALDEPITVEPCFLLTEEARLALSDLAESTISPPDWAGQVRAMIDEQDGAA